MQVLNLYTPNIKYFANLDTNLIDAYPNQFHKYVIWGVVLDEM